MKALILAGGRGSRMDEASKDINKCMLRVRGKPLIEYSLECAAGLEKIEEIVIVVGYRAEDIINCYGNVYKDKKIQYILQREPCGLVHAIESARPALADSDFMLMLGDEFMINPHHKEFVEEFTNSGVFSLCGIVTVEDKELIKKTYTVIQSDDSRIFRLVEKPNNPFNNLMGTGNCIFKNKIFDYVVHTPINQKRGEKELPDLIQCAIDDGHVVKSFLICQKYINVNHKEEWDKTKSYFSHF